MTPKERGVTTYCKTFSENESRNSGLGNNETQVIKLRFAIPEAMLIIKSNTF